MCTPVLVTSVVLDFAATWLGHANMPGRGEMSEEKLFRFCRVVTNPVTTAINLRSVS